MLVRSSWSSATHSKVTQELCVKGCKLCVFSGNMMIKVMINNELDLLLFWGEVELL